MREGVRRATVDARAARVIVLNSVSPLEKEQAGLVNVLGRVLADDVTAENGIPSFDTASTAGYALISSDTTGASRSEPRPLSVLSETASQTTLVEPGTLVPVREGEVLPRGADAVVGARSAYRTPREPEVLVMAQCMPWDNVTRAGSSIRAGTLILSRGSVVGPGEAALLARIGHAAVPVTRRSRVGVITTGANVVEVADRLAPGEGRNSARYWLLGMVLAANCELGRLMHVREGRIGIERAISECVGCDAVVLALGHGERHDSALDAIAHLGSLRFERMLMEPAPACAFGMIGSIPVFVVPADYVLEGFEALVRPGLMALMGRSDVERPNVKSRLQSTLRTDPGACHYERACTSYGDEGYVSVPINARDSGLEPWNQPNSLIIVPENIETARRGSLVDVMLLVD